MNETPSFNEDFFRKKSGFHHTTIDNPGVAAFDHLRSKSEFCDEGVHWAFKILSEKLKSGKYDESNESCKEMLKALSLYLQEYRINSNRVLSRDLKEKLEHISSFLVNSNVMTIGMETALNYIVKKFHDLDSDPEISEVYSKISGVIDTFISEKLDLPSSIIAGIGSEMIKSGDVILIFDYSSTVVETLLKAKSSGKNFRVIVTDSRVRLAGKKALKEFVRHKIYCTYILISNVSYHMSEVTRVILGAEGIHNNCSLLNKVGTAMICCIANAFKKPVLVCVETYKFSDKTQTDSFRYNVLNPDSELVKTDMYEGDTRMSSVLESYTSPKLLKLNLKYDITPSTYIDMLITEVGAIPVSSVPVVLREFNESF